MPTDPTYLIVGASLCGAKAAETLREEGFGGRVILLGSETERPYERPPLSKGYLLGKEDKSVIYVHEEGWYAGHDVDLRLGSGSRPPSAGAGGWSPWARAGSAWRRRRRPARPAAR